MKAKIISDSTRGDCLSLYLDLSEVTSAVKDLCRKKIQRTCKLATLNVKLYLDSKSAFYQVVNYHVVRGVPASIQNLDY